MLHGGMWLLSRYRMLTPQCNVNRRSRLQSSHDLEKIETVIIGGGQAGLAMSYYLGQLGREHVILERQRVAERWRSERWDSLTFQSPNWNIHLPGFAFQAADPDAFSSRDDVLRFIESYAAFIHAPLRLGGRGRPT
jgi:putative flavoprotein involved in K+ transport